MGTAQWEGSSSSLRSGKKKQEYQVPNAACSLRERMKDKGVLVRYFFCEAESVLGVLGFGDSVCMTWPRLFPLPAPPPAPTVLG